MAASDSNAILPVRIGTGLAILATVIAGVIGPMSPNELINGEVWWFGAAMVASVSGGLGLLFLQRRARALRISS
ncbi:MAG: hypothetical protein OR995_04165 [Candidatus Nanopelagicales bacterium]|jgi:hypothetical protein|nr:hypothetical protein [Candidatus Nanopelagicales bacterium]